MRRRRQGRSYIEREPAIDLNIVREVVYYIISTFIAVLVAVVVVRCFGLRIRMTGASMEPLLIDGQSVLVDRMHYRIASIEPGDVIVFYPGGNEDAHPFVKRVAAGPGQTVQITDGTLLIDGVPAPGAENYDKIEDPGLAKNPVTLGEDEYFVLGDNRNNSEDSRSAGIGNVSGGDVIGRAWLSLPAGQAGVSRIH
ncbi:MAG: signal peptidase I [Lachnospiraceae bacterium]|nr:signal peptidase I [Lachnospiraceae bacterium]